MSRIPPIPEGFEPEPAPTPKAERINRALEGRLAGMGDAFVRAGERYGVDPEFLAAVSLHETGGGSFKGAPSFAAANNAAGVMDPETGWSRPKQFAQLEDSIDFTAKNLRSNYLDQGLTTLDQIGAKYAPPGAANDPKKQNQSWAPGVLSYLEKMNGPAGGSADPAQDPDHIPTPPAYTKDGKPQQIFRSFDGEIEQLDPTSINWNGVPVIYHNYSAPPPAKNGIPPIPEGFEVEDSNAVPPIPEGFEAEKPQGFLANAWNSFAKGATAEGIFAATEGAGRGLANIAKDAATAVESKTTDELQTELTDLQKLRNAPRLGNVAVDVGLSDQISEIERVLDARKSGSDPSETRKGWRKVAADISGVLNAHADNTGAYREMLREKLPVDAAFSESLAGQVLQGFGQMAGTLPTYVIPGFGPAMTLGQMYDEGYQDAIRHQASPEQAHAAALKYLPASALEVVADKFVIGKILKPLKGKVTVADIAKTVAVTAPVEGATEGTQQLWLNLVAGQLANYDPERKLDDEVINSIIVGSIVGAGTAGAGTTATAALSGNLQLRDPEKVSRTQDLENASEGMSDLANQFNVVVDPTAESEAFGESENNEPSQETPTPAEVKMSKPVQGITLAEVGNDFVVDPVEPTLTDLNEVSEDIDGHALEILRGMPESVTAADGSQIVLHNPDRGSIKYRARHLVISDGNFSNPKIRWLPMIPETIQNAAVRLVDSKSGNRIYVRAYKDGTKHMVVVNPQGRVETQKPFKGGLNTQFPKGSNRQQSMQIDWVRPEPSQKSPALGSQPSADGATHDSAQLSDTSIQPEPPVAVNQKVAETVARAFQDNTPNGPRIEVVRKVDDLRGRFGEDIHQSLVNERPEAFYDPDSDTTVLVAENFSPLPNESLSQYITRKILHESAGHGGLMRLFDGPLSDEYGKIMAALWRQIARADFGNEWHQKHKYRNLAQLAVAYGYDLRQPGDVFATLEEHLARLAEEPNPPTWFDEIVAQITALLRSAGYNAWTDADTRVLLAKARKQVGIDAKTVEKQTDIRFSKAIDEAAADPVKKRKFIESVQSAEKVLPEVKERIQGVYSPVSNAETVNQANDWINERGIEKAWGDLLTVSAPEAFHYAAGIELISRLQAGGRFDDAAQLVESMAEKATDQGRAIQSLSLLAKLTPEGIQFYTAKIIRKTVEKNPALKDLHGKISELREQLRKAKHQLATAALLNAKRKGSGLSVQEWLNRLLVDNKGSLWGRYREGAMNQLVNKMLGPGTPERPAALEEFTRRLTRHLREQLPDRGLATDPVKPAPQDESAMIGEAIRNFDKYREVWKAAQTEVQERYRDNPEALQSLDNYLGAILETPFSPASVDRAVRQNLQDINLSMREVLKQSGTDKAKTQSTIRDLIISKAGVSGADADGVAAAVLASFDRQQQETRDRLLKAMSTSRDIQLPKSQLQRLIELNNSGALDDTRFFAALAKHFGIPAWTPELSAKVQKLQREHELATDPDLKLAKAAQMFDAVHELVPADAFTKIRAVQNIALLLNPKTLIRNIGGNIAMFTVNVPADALTAWVIDPLVSIATGKRTRTTVAIGAQLQGLAKPVEDFWNGYRFTKDQGATTQASISEGLKTVLTLARLASRGKYDIGQVNQANSRVLSSKVGKLLEDTLGLSLSVFDRSFHQAAFRGSLIRQMNIAKRNGENLVSPTPEMVEEAMLDASRAIFQDENFASKALNKIGKGLNLASTVGKSDQYGIGSVILPFTQVPGAILMRGLEWTPVGYIRNAYEIFRPLVTKQEFRQKEFVDAFSRASLGSAGISLGFWLATIGVISAIGEEDPDLDAMLEASGLGKYRLNWSALKRALLSGNWWTRQEPQDGDVTVNYDWLQPSAMPLAVGAEISNRRERDRLNQLRGSSGALASGWVSDVLSAGAAGLKTLEAQPLLMGLSRFARDAGREGVITATAMSALDAPGMFVPTFISQINQLMDNTVRETRAGSPWEQSMNRLLARVPGMANRFPARYDVFGEAQERYSYGGNSFFNVLINPAMLSRVKQSPALREMSHLYSATGDGAVLPRKVDRQLTIAGQRVELTNEQISDYQHLMGTATVNLYARLAAAPNFARLTVGAKAAVVEKVLSAAHAQVKIAVLKGNPEMIQEIRSLNEQKQQAARTLMQTR